MTAQAEDATKLVTYALVEVGPLKLGVDTRCVMQAIPRPSHMTPMPRVQGALDGVFSLRGQVVPVVNLQKWRRPGAATHDPAQVLVLRSGNKVIGLAVDAVRGLLKASPAEVQQVHHDDDPNEFFHSVALAEDKTTLVNLLDPERLMTQVQAWSQDVAGSELASWADATVQTAQDPEQNLTEIYAVVRLGGSLLGFSTQVVGEILALPRLQSMFGSASPFMGMVTWRGRDVPVSDIRQALGLPAGSNAAAPWLLVLSVEGRCMGLPVDDIQVVRAFSASDVQPTTAVGAQASLFRGTVLGETGERIFLLDGAALMNNNALSAISQRAVTTNRTPQIDNDRSSAHVVFRAGVAWAAPMTQMLAITPFPDTFHRTRHENSYLLGTFEWRGQALPLLDLRQIEGQSATPLDANTRIIVIQVGRQLAGLMVEEVMALIPAHVGTHARFSMGRDTLVHIVTLGDGEAQKSYQVMDFTALAFFRAEPGSAANR